MSALFSSNPNCPSRRAWLVLFWSLLTVFAVSSPGLAQDETDVEELIDKRYHRVYVPNEALPRVWSFHEGVLLGQQEFRELVKQAESRKAAETDRPGDFLLSDVTYRAELNGDVMVITATCKLSKQSPGWAQLKLPLKEVSLLKATLGDKPAPLGLLGEANTLVLLDNFTGSRQLELVVTSPLERSGTDELARFAIFPPGPASLKIDVPAGRTIEVNGARMEADGPQPDARDMTIPVGQSEPVSIRLSDALSESLEESLVFASTDYSVAVERDSVRWQAVSQLRTFGKRFNKLEFAVPQRLEVTAVEASGLQSWEIKDDTERPGHFRLLLSFRETLPDQIAVTLRGVQLLEDDQMRWRVAPLAVLGATTHTGRLALTAPRDIRMKAAQLTGIRPASGRWEIAKSMKGQTEQFYEVWEEDFTLEVAMAELAGEVHAAVSHVLNVGELDVLLSSVVTLQTQFTPVFELTAEVPAGWQPESITEKNQPLAWQYDSRDEKTTRLRIPLSPPLKPGEKRTLQFRLTLQREGGLFTTEAESFPLPTLQLDGVRILEGTYAINAAAALDIVPEEITGMDPALLGLPGERFGFRYQDSVISGSVQVKRKTPRFNASTQTTVWLDEQLAHAQILSTLDISGGGLRQVTVDISPLPQVDVEMQAGGNVRISEQKRTKTETGMRWTLTFDRYMTGTVKLALPLLVERDDDAWPTPTVQFPKAELQDQYLAFLAEDDQQLTLEVTGGAGQKLDPLDQADVPLTIPAGRRLVVAGYHLTQPGAKASVAVETFDTVAVPTAIGRELTLESLLLGQGTFQQQATLRFAAVGVQSLLVALPEGARLWSTMVDGQPLTARRTAGGFLVPLSGLSGGTDDHRLTVVYGLNGDSLGLGNFTRATLPAPTFAAVDGQGGQRALPTLQSRWQLHHPAETHVQAVSPGVHLAEGGADDSWRERFLKRIGRLGTDDIAFSVGVGAAACLFAGLLAFFVGRFRARAALPIVLGVAGLFLLGICLLPAVQKSRESARRSADSQAMSEPMEEFTGSGEGFGIGAFEGAEDAEQMDADGDMLGEVTNEAEIEHFDRNGIVLEQKVIGPDDVQMNRRTLEEFRRNRPAQQRSPGGFARSAPAGGGFGGGGFGGSAQTAPAPPQSELSYSNGNRPAPAAAPMTVTPGDGVAASPFADSPALSAKPAEKDKAKEQAKQQAGKRVAANQGLLSLPLTLQIPSRLETTVFETYQSADGGLTIRYLSQSAVERLRWVCLSVTVLLFWLLRNISARRKAGLAVLLLGLGTAAIGVLPAALLPVVEGLLAGTLLGLLVWLAIWLIQYVPKHLFDEVRWTGKVSSTAGLLLFAAICSSSGSVLAEEKQAEPAEEKSFVVFPFDLDEGPLANDQVFVPAEEYKKLTQQARPDWMQPAAPAAYHIHEANYSAQFVPAADKEKSATISLQGRYVVESYRRGEQKIPLPIDSMVVKSMQVDGKPAGAVLAADNRPAVLLTEAGVRVVDVEYELPAEVFGTAGQFAVNFQPVASGSLSFRLPNPELRVEVNDGKIAYRKVERDGGMIAEIPISSGGVRDVSWQPDVESSGSEFLSCESSREVRLEDQGAELRYTFAFRIAQGTFSEAEFQLPAGVQLKTLSGNDVAGWQRVDENRLRVLLKRAVDDRTEIGLSLHASLDIEDKAQEWTLPDVQPLGVTREIGTWGIDWEPALEVRVEQTEAVRQMPVNQFPRIGSEKLVQTFERVYRFTGRPHEIELSVYRRNSELVANQMTVVDVQLHKTHIATHAAVTIEGQPRLSLEFALPTGLQIIDLQAADLENWFVQPAKAEGESTLTVSFREPQQGRVDVYARGHVQQEAQAGKSLTVKALELKGVARGSNYLAIGAAESLGLRLEDQGNWRTTDPQRLPSDLRQMASFEIRLGLTVSADSTGPVGLGVLQATPLLSGNSVSVIAVTDLSLDYGLSLEWDITNAAASEFSFVGPNWFVDRISFTSTQIRHIRTTKLDDDRTRWTIETKSPLARKFLVAAAVSLPLPADRLVTVPPIDFVTGPDADAAKRSLETQGHYAVLVNLGREPLESVSDHQRELIEASELPLTIPESMRQQAVEIVRVTRAMKPSWELKELEQAELPPATIPLAEMTTAIDGAGVWRTAATYQVKNREQQFLPLLLPENSRLLSVMVGERPARPVAREIDGKAVQLIAMPTTGAADLAVKVTVVLEGRLPEPILASWGRRRVSLPAPQVLNKEQSEAYGIPVMHTVWKLTTPEEMQFRALSGEGTNVSLASEAEAERISILNSIKAITEMSKIVQSSKFSSQQRARAQKNLKALKGDVEYYLRDDVQSIDKNDDLNLNSTLESLDDAVKLQLDDQMDGATVNQQSLGRNYILENNGEILRSNGLSGLYDPNPSTDDVPFRQGEFQVNPNVTQDERIKMPSKSFSKSGAGKGDSGVVGNIVIPSEREQLLEENMRQNDFLNRDLLRKEKQSQQQSEQIVQQAPQQPLGWAAPQLNWDDGYAANNWDAIQNEALGVTDAPVVSGMALAPQETSGPQGGLSLPVELPQFGNAATYSKVGGQPELRIEVYSQAWKHTVLGAIWAVVLLGLTVWVMWLLPRFQHAPHLHPILVIGMLAALAAFVVLPAGLAGLCLAGAVVLAMVLGGMSGRNRLAK
ncbi:hypothetical protein [Rubinisphaera brasiliensis]|uniref:Uncharacterized protein n=1 Tax=Rubinisphaera brasiliensis (strain ATCC 49424 / DSM 5305 / JCM 21570 / IAM 15109 / NBRC 103401 / IFAM 1448) TaxID=756272 RepID=F0SMP6_RUBBR|nr:hypothetical protein [Rubinisphaera brasiliensis]ADY58865.1 hypothetical protein Plabr_1252 [Rubinisphaera brasiliensis DSM 5305]